eukprot:2011255-Amphidinium_carterae.1
MPQEKWGKRGCGRSTCPQNPRGVRCDLTQQKTERSENLYLWHEQLSRRRPHKVPLAGSAPSRPVHLASGVKKPAGLNLTFFFFLGSSPDF